VGQAMLYTSPQAPTQLDWGRVYFKLNLKARYKKERKSSCWYLFLKNWIHFFFFGDEGVKPTSRSNRLFLKKHCLKLLATFNHYELFGWWYQTSMLLIKIIFCCKKRIKKKNNQKRRRQLSNWMASLIKASFKSKSPSKIV